MERYKTLQSKKPLQRKTALKSKHGFKQKAYSSLSRFGKKARRIKAEMDALTPMMKVRSQGKCEHVFSNGRRCGKVGTWPGKGWRQLERHHLDHDRENNTPENLQFWCWACHHGPDGHDDA